MKGVVVQIGEKKSVVMFNNGKIGVIPSPPHCRIGMVVDLSYNRGRFVLWAVVAVVIIAALVLLARNLYFTPAGYLHITYGQRARAGASLELGYNHFERVVFARPLTTAAVAPLSEMNLLHKSLAGAYRRVIETWGGSWPPGSPGRVTVRIAHDNLERVKKIEQELLPLASAVPHDGNGPPEVDFERYTLELYREALEPAARGPFPAEGIRGHSRERRRGGRGEQRHRGE